MTPSSRLAGAACASATHTFARSTFAVAVAILATLAVSACSGLPRLARVETLQSGPAAGGDRAVLAFGALNQPSRPGLCLSGGGNRAVLYAAGIMLRLYEIGALDKFGTVSSVSGGSVTAAKVAQEWGALYPRPGAAPQRAVFIANVVDPLRSLASHTVDWPAVLEGFVLPGSANEFLSRALNRYLFKGFQLSDLRTGPLFVFNTTRLDDGVRWEVTQYGMGPTHGAVFQSPQMELATAASISAAFPPVLAPRRFNLNKMTGVDNPDLYENVAFADGGVTGNLGLQYCASVPGSFVADAAGITRQKDVITNNWFEVTARTIDAIYGNREDETRATIQGGVAVAVLKQAAGATIPTLPMSATWLKDLAEGRPANAVLAELANLATVAPRKTGCAALNASESTRFAKVGDEAQMHLINWGYLKAEEALDRWGKYPAERTSVPFDLPYPQDRLFVETRPAPMFGQPDAHFIAPDCMP